MDELLTELQALIDAAEAGELTDEQAQRMADLTAEVNQRTADAESAQQRTNAARAAIEAGQATRIDSVQFNRNQGGMQFSGSIQDTTDYSRLERSAFIKDLAHRSGIALVDGEMTPQERTAFTHLTSNTGSAVPTELQNEIISLIDSSAVLFGDVRRDNFAHVYEVLRHKAIAAGDAAATDEGAAPSNDEQNTFDTITIDGVEIKKTVKMSRKMQVQSVAAFDAYIVSEIAARLAASAEGTIISTLSDATYGMASANKISVTGVGATLTKAALVQAFGKIKTFNNPASKGCIVYANGNTIWNQIAMVEDANNRSYFIQSELTDDPTIQGRIFGKLVKQDDAIADDVILIGYPDLFRSNIFDGIDIRPYIENGTQQRCWDGYLLYGGVLAVPTAFAKITVDPS